MTMTMHRCGMFSPFLLIRVGIRIRNYASLTLSLSVATAASSTLRYVGCSYSCLTNEYVHLCVYQYCCLTNACALLCMCSRAYMRTCVYVCLRVLGVFLSVCVRMPVMRCQYRALVLRAINLILCVKLNLSLLTTRGPTMTCACLPRHCACCSDAHPGRRRESSCHFCS